ncbi:MAG: hypothetical protein V4850_07255 [Myxococcota bacterium]
MTTLRAALLPILIGVAACGAVTEPLVAAAGGGGQGAQEPDVAVVVERVLSAPEMRESIESLARALLAGAHDELGRPEWEALLRERSADLVEGMAPALARGLETDIGPALRRELARGVERALAQLADPGTQAQLADITRAVTTAVIDTLLLDPNATEPSRPALRRATEHVLLGVGDALQGDLGTALHGFLRTERQAIAEDTRRSGRPLRWLLYGLVGILLPTVVIQGVLLRRARRR